MTTESSTSPRGRRQAAMWIAAFVALVLIVPMATFGKNMLFKSDQAGPAAKAKPVVTGGVPYVTREAFSLGMGDGPTEADVILSPDNVEVSTVEVIAPSPDGKSVWVVDHPDSVRGAARVRRFSNSGKLEVEFKTQPASTMFTPGRKNDLWAVRSSGSRRETLVNYGPDGKVKREYLLPEAFITRSIAIDPDGEVWAQYEEWVVDPKVNANEYSSSLTPIVKADGTPVPNVTPEMSADGSFIGADDRLYWPTTAPGRQSENQYPPFLVIARDQQGENVTEYDIADGGRPYAADSQGRVFTEGMPGNLAETPGVSTLGDPGYNIASVGIFTAAGEYARLNVTRDPSMGLWAPAAWPTDAGELYSWRWEGGRLRVFVSVPVPDAKPLVTDGEVRAPDVRVLFSENEPMSGDPYRAIDAAQRDLWQAVYSGLVSMDGSLTAQPDLAEAVPAPGAGVSADGKTVTWTIREGRTFHDGKPVTAADVAATWEYLKTMSALDAAEPFPGFDHIQAVKAEGRTVTVTLDQPFGAAPEAFFPFVLPKHVVDDARGQINGGLRARPVGSGPYKVARWEPGRMQLERADKTGEGLGVVELVFDPSKEVRQRFVTADVPTVWSWVSDADLSILRRDAVGDITEARTGRWFGLVVNMMDPLMTSAELRDAMLATYPSSVVRDLYGLSETDTVSPFGAGVPIDTYGAGEQAVKRLSSVLTASGYVNKDSDPFLEADGRDLRFRYSQTMSGPSIHETLAEVEESYKREVDKSKAVLDWENGQQNYYAPVTGAGFLTRGRHQIGSAVFPGFVDAGWGSVFDPADTPTWTDADGMSVTFVEDDELKALHAAARRSYDRNERREIGQRIVERVRELRVAYFDRPEVRPVATLGVAGVNPAPFPAGLFHDVESWKLEEQK